MRSIFLSVLLVLSLGKSSQAQSTTPRYSNLWRPITPQGIKESIRLHRNNPIGLEEVMMRSLLQQKAFEYLTAIEAASQAEPKNANLIAAYGWGLALSRGSFSTTAQPIPQQLAKRFKMDEQSIQDTIQRARDIDYKCWLADIAEASLWFGGLAGRPTKGASLTQKAYNVRRNALTMTRYGSELIFQGASLRDVEMQKKGLNILLKAQRLYPTYWRVQMEVYLAYTYPKLSRPGSAKAASQKFMALIPPESRNLPWVKRYVDYLGIAKGA